jgi:ABC-type lipoprotein export system ATPase subunit
MEARVDVESVRKAWGAGGSGGDGTVSEALGGVSFSLAPGDFVALLGALERPSSGRVLVDGRDLSLLDEGDKDLYRRRTAATVFQLFNLLPTMTSLENVALPLLLDGVGDDEAETRAEKALAKVGLPGKAGLALEVVPLLADQELVTDRSTRVSGRAYVELTGHAGKGALGLF